MALFDPAALLAWATGLLQAYGALSVFGLVLLEEIVVPIPSPIFPMAAGFIFIPAGATILEAVWTSFFLIALPGAAAVVIGSLAIYAVGYYGGEAVIKRFHRFFGVSPEEMRNMTNKLENKRTWATIVVLRAIPVFPTSVVTLAAGILELDWKRFSIATFIGAIPRIMILSIIGWQFGGAFLAFAESFGLVETALF